MIYIQTNKQSWKFLKYEFDPRLFYMGKKNLYSSTSKHIIARSNINGKNLFKQQAYSNVSSANLMGMGN